MKTLKKHFVKLAVMAALALLALMLEAQGPPNACANTCLQSFKAKVRACKGDAACVADARASAEACVRGCIQ